METRSIEDSMEEYDRLNNIPIDVTNEVTHEEFVSGAHNRTHGFKVIEGESNQLLSGGRKAAFNILALLYQLAPFVIIPIFAIFGKNWWLLIGIGFSEVASFVATFTSSAIFFYGSWKWISRLMVLVLLSTIAYTIVHWLNSGIHFFDPSTFFTFCSLWGYALFKIADNAQKKFAMRSILESPELFYAAISAGRIMIIRRRDA